MVNYGARKAAVRAARTGCTSAAVSFPPPGPTTVLPVAPACTASPFSLPELGPAVPHLSRKTLSRELPLVHWCKPSLCPWEHLEEKSNNANLKPQTPLTPPLHPSPSGFQQETNDTFNRASLKRVHHVTVFKAWTELREPIRADEAPGSPKGARNEIVSPKPDARAGVRGGATIGHGGTTTPAGQHVAWLLPLPCQDLCWPNPTGNKR